MTMIRTRSRLAGEDNDDDEEPAGLPTTTRSQPAGNCGDRDEGETASNDDDEEELAGLPPPPALSQPAGNGNDDDEEPDGR